MKRSTLVALIAVLVLLSGSALAQERRHGVGLGLVGGTGEPENGPELDFNGLAIYGKIGITSNWGLFISYRDMEDDEDFFDESDEYTQIAVHGAYTWRTDKKVRPHVKFGLAKTDLEISAFGFSIDDDATGLSIGGGLEAGSEKVAFFGDIDVTQAELFDVDFDFTNVTAGVIFKF